MLCQQLTLGDASIEGVFAIHVQHMAPHAGNAVILQRSANQVDRMADLLFHFISLAARSKDHANNPPIRQKYYNYKISISFYIFFKKKKILIYQF
jgi:hypothetical protein